MGDTNRPVDIVAKGKDPATGQFVKGNKIRPKNPSGKRKDYWPILKAVAEDAYTPDEITALIHETVDMAREAQDWKGVYAMLRLVLDYTVGKPVQRTLTASMDADELRQMFFASEETNDELDGGEREVIDLEPGVGGYGLLSE